MIDSTLLIVQGKFLDMTISIDWIRLSRMLAVICLNIQCLTDPTAIFLRRRVQEFSLMKAMQDLIN